MSDYFKDIPHIPFEGKDSSNPLSFKYYDAQKNVLGKPLEEHLRMAVCYWHTFNWPGSDPFGGQTFLRPWMESGDPIGQAKDKLENAFSFFEKLGIPYF
jgi:xylose isomerase